jgi:Ni/Fe-hydrogenase 1 B-type cytochrome subunit
MQGSAASSVASASGNKALYVFEVPVRVWHVTHALSIVVLAVTGYLIAHPLASPDGEASEHFLMGDMRMIHLIAAYVFTIGFAVRIYWAFVGNQYSRELFILPLWSGHWWRDLFEEVKYYLFLRRSAPPALGHNALAQAAMWLFNVILGLFMIVTGFALHGEALGLGSWADRWFGWLIPMLGGAQSVRMWHLLGMWLFIVFSIIHIYMAWRAEFMGSQSSIKTIVNGWRVPRNKNQG